MSQIRKSQKNNRKSLRRKTARKTRGGNNKFKGNIEGSWDILGRFVIKDKNGKKVKCKNYKDQDYIDCVEEKQKIYEKAAQAYKKSDAYLHYYLDEKLIKSKNRALHKRMASEASEARKNMEKLDKKINHDKKLMSVLQISQDNYNEYLKELNKKGRKIPSLSFAKDSMPKSSTKNSTRKHYNTI